jgi:hypothetical protein
MISVISCERNSPIHPVWASLDNPLCDKSQKG